MPPVPIILRMRRRRAKHPTPHLLPQAGIGASLALSLLLAALVLSSAAAYITVTSDLPSLDELPALLDDPYGKLLNPTRLYDRTGIHELAVLEDPAAAGHRYITIRPGQADLASDPLIQATLAAQDSDFWQHSGFSLVSLNSDLHPTLAQKLVFETLLFTEPPGLRRNLRERLLAAQATGRFGREQILEWYLNHALYGERIYGADAAALAYLGKPADQLSLAEAAVLAAVARQPDVDPRQFPQLVLEGQKDVLQSMLALGWIEGEDAQQAEQEKVVFRLPLPGEEAAGEATTQAFVELVLTQLSSQMPRDRIERGGWHIITTLDFDLQQQTACAAEALTTRLGTATGSAAGIDNPEDCQAARLLPTLPQEVDRLPRVESAVIVLDPNTGQVLSLVGAVLQEQPDQAPERPLGTLTLPFLYLTAFTRGFSPGSLAWDIPSNQEEAASDLDIYHGPVRLRTALVNDYFQPARQLLSQFGVTSVLGTARLLGLQADPAPGDEALDTLLDQPGSLFSIAQAYATLDNQGVSVGQVFHRENGDPQDLLQPYSILRVEDSLGQTWLDWSTPQQRLVISPQLAYMLNHVLSDETARWPSLGHPNPLEIGQPASGKLGQTNQETDAWTVGYTTQRLVAVWLGIPDPEEGEQVPPQAAASLWHAVIQYAMRSQPATGWSLPLMGGVSEIQVCDPSGLLPTIYCPTVVSEVYLSGSEPTQLDNLYRISQINRETGRLATVFTPPELLEERVFLVVPPEAREWAEKAGLPTPPEDYDILYAPPTTSPDVQILAPVLFSQVSGQVTLKGSAAGPAFKSFRINFGQGLNPQRWLQIGQETTRPIREGILGIWDTTGLSGLYALQLQVIRQDLRIETALIQVTVDNQLPNLTLLNPPAGTNYDMAQQPAVILSASASDNLELAQVNFYLNDQEIASFAVPPYTLAWSPRLGDHTWRVVAIDLAGNQSEQSLQFSVK